MNDKTSVLPPFAATIGLDWADKKHDIWLRDAATGRFEHRVIKQTPEALHEWVAQLRKRFNNQRIAVAVETSRGAIISGLLAYEFIVVFPINPKMLCSYREAFCVSGAKDDRTDAMLLEEYARLHGHKLRAFKPDTELTRKLAALVEYRRQLVDERTRLVNQLHSLVKMYYPLVETLFANFTLPLVSAFLAKWPELGLLQKASPTAVRNFFFAHNCRRTAMIEERLETIAKAQPLTTDRALIEPAALKAKALAGMLQPLHKSIANLDVTIKQAMDAHPDAAIFRSFPGAAAVMAPRLLVAFGTDRERFNSAQEVQQLYGIAPVKKESGQSHVIQMRFRCPKFGRQTFHENASHALKEADWMRTFYDQQRARQKAHHVSVRSLSFKLIRIYFRCWKMKTSYDSNVYAAALQKHGSPLIKTKTSKPSNPPCE